MLVAYVLLSVGTASVVGALVAPTSWIAAAVAAPVAASFIVPVIAMLSRRSPSAGDRDDATSSGSDGVVWR